MKNAAIVPDVFDVSVFKPEVIPDAQLRECVDFRNEIYLEQGYLPEAVKLNDPDQYDRQSSHVCVRNMETGRLSAYCRMIYDAPLPLPICVLCPDLKKQIDTHVENQSLQRQSQLARPYERQKTWLPFFCSHTHYSS